LPHIKENFILCATNPDSPAHAAYEYFIDTDDENRKVYYSRTDQNPFLPATYIERLKARMTKMEVRRYIFGEWVEIKSESIYYAYDKHKSAILKNYRIDEKYPLCWTWDFNIGENKPMSCLLYQYINGSFYFFKEFVVHSARTLDICEEVNSTGFLDYNVVIKIQGDATGRRRDTRSIHSDYEIISKYLSNLENKYGSVKFIMDVGVSNPPVRERHSIVNGQLENSFGQTFIYLDPKECPNLDKGLRLTKLKKGGSYIEDDSDPWQHVTTSLGYGVVRTLKETNIESSFIKTKL